LNRSRFAERVHVRDIVLSASVSCRMSERDLIGYHSLLREA